MMILGVPSRVVPILAGLDAKRMNSADEITVSAPNERVDLGALKQPRLGGKEPSDDDYRL